MLPSVLAFSLGQGGYDAAFSNAVDSQREYCTKHGYKYFCVAEQGSPALGRENIWLKPLLVYGALLKNDHVLYLDTDVAIRPDCPAIESAVSQENPIGLVAGHSGRINAGVIIARKTAMSLEFFAKWVACLGKPIAARHDVGWGENGHLIRLAEKHGIDSIDTRWNNTFLPDLDDYIRHYTGPLRNEYKFTGDSKVAWDRILAELSVSKALDPTDIVTSFAELQDVYTRSAPPELFANFDATWDRPKSLVFPDSVAAPQPGPLPESHVYVAEQIADDSPNAYVVTLRDSLERAFGAQNVTTGIASFWDHTFTADDILHIEWIESLFGWKVPSQDQLTDFEHRMKEIAATSPIIFTAHNFDLMPTYGDDRIRMMQAVADHATLICHLSPANISPYNAHHSMIQGLKDVPTAVVPHGDYQPYFRQDSEPFDDPALKSDKIKILVFGHIRTAKELNFCLDVGKELGEDRFQMIFTGAIHPDIIHWKKIHRYRDEWDGGARRIHFKVPSEQVTSLVSQCDAMLVPRFDRLNSGVQFLAYSLLKPVFVPAQTSMEEVQQKVVSDGIFALDDVKSAADMIRRNFDDDLAAQMKRLFQINEFNYAAQDLYSVGAAHKAAYEQAVEKFNLRASDD